MADIKLRSPGVEISELDLTGATGIQINPTAGGYAGIFDWGAGDEITPVSTETELVAKFGKPGESGAVSFLLAANFLKYSNNLRVVRAINDDIRDPENVTRTAVAKQRAASGINAGMIRIHNTGKHQNPANIVVTISAPDEPGGDQATATIAATQFKDGNILGLTVTNPGSGYTQPPTISLYEAGVAEKDTATAAIGTLTDVGQTELDSYFAFDVDVDATTMGRANSDLQVVFSAPAAGGTRATGYIDVAHWQSGSGTIESVTIDQPGSGYTTAPTVQIFVKDNDNLLPTAFRYGAGLNDVLWGDGRVWSDESLVIKNDDAYYDLLFDSGIPFTPGINATGQIAGSNTANAIYLESNSFGPFAARYPGERGSSIKVSVCDGTRAWYDANTVSNPDDPVLGAAASWEYAALFDAPPSTSAYAKRNGVAHDELHIVVIDERGWISGTPGAVLEKFAHVSKLEDARRDDGEATYYRDVLYKKSRYVYWLNHSATHNALNWGAVATEPNVTECGRSDRPVTIYLKNGANGNPTAADLARAWDSFSDKETVEIDLLFAGDANAAVRDTVISIADRRRDCMAFVSPSFAAVTDSHNKALAIVAEAAVTQRTSFAIMDSGWKYVYDKFHDKYRWVPLNSDIAGLVARSNATGEPWQSPARQSNGSIKDVVKLAFNPRQADRDILYSAGVNPVITVPGEGTRLYGDKTLLTGGSAFGNINVRGLFNYLEKAIGRAATDVMFEINDEFTQSQFYNRVEPLFRMIKGRRGVYDYRIVCDGSVNTPDVVDAQQFVATFWIKPARSINYIKLNFVAVRGDAVFDEIITQI